MRVVIGWNAPVLDAVGALRGRSSCQHVEVL
jgi:hypothetical protein